MKSFTYALCGAVIALSFASCTETAQPTQGSIQEVDICCNVASQGKSRGMDSKGMFGDGKEATKLSYVLYKDGQVVESYTSADHAAEASEPVLTSDGSFKFKLKIPRDGDYDIFLWADAFGDWFNDELTMMFDEDSGDMVYDQLSAIGKFDKADAFYAYGRVYDNSSKVLNTNFTLTRPFCQVNVLTDEAIEVEDEIDLLNFSTGFIFKDGQGNIRIPEEVNLFDTEAGCSLSALSNGKRLPIINLYEMNDVADESKTVTLNGRKMRYLYSAYLLAPKESEVEYPAYLYASRDPEKDVNECLVELDVKSAFKANNQIFIYPKAGTKIFPSDGKLSIDISVVNSLGWSGNTNHETSN